MESGYPLLTHNLVELTRWLIGETSAIHKDISFVSSNCKWWYLWTKTFHLSTATFFQKRGNTG